MWASKLERTCVVRILHSGSSVTNTSVRNPQASQAMLSRRDLRFHRVL